MLIFATSFGYGDTVIQKARDNPEVLFEHATGFQLADNVSTYFVRHWEPSFLLGVIAGHVSESRRLGYVGSFPIPEVIRDVNSFTLGAPEHQPGRHDSDALHQHVVRPADRAAGGPLADRRRSGHALRDHGQPERPPSGGRGGGSAPRTWNSDMGRFGPEAFLSSVVLNWGPRYVQRTEQAIDGTWESEDWWGTLAEDAVQLAPVRRVRSRRRAGGGGREARRLRRRLVQPVRRPDQQTRRARCGSRTATRSRSSSSSPGTGSSRASKAAFPNSSNWEGRRELRRVPPAGAEGRAALPFEGTVRPATFADLAKKHASPCRPTTSTSSTTTTRSTSS